MDAIRQWAFSVCAAMVACGLSRMLLPKSGLDKIFRTTVSVFFLCCLLSPIVIQNPGIRIQVEEYSQEEIERRARRLEQVVDAQTGNMVDQELKKIISEKLLQMGINYHTITINFNTDGQSGQGIEKVEIVLDSVHAKDHEAIHAELTKTLGLTVRLGYESSGEGGR